MSRNPASFPSDLPEALKARGYHAAGESAWPRDAVLDVIEWLSRMRLAVARIEVWLPTRPGPTIPTPFIYTWEGEDREEGESWSEYVGNSNELAAGYVRSFKWDPGDDMHQLLVPYFNLNIEAEPDVTVL